MSNNINANWSIEDGTLYKTLSGALANLAERSFYEDCTIAAAIAPTIIGDRQIVGYAVMDDCNMAPSEDVYWIYDEGLEYSVLPGYECEDSGLMEPSETFYCAANITRYLPRAVEAIESGYAVSFAYAPVNVYECDDCKDSADIEDMNYDHLAGWTLIAIWKEGE